MKTFQTALARAAKTAGRYGWVTIQNFGKNGLANHAAAGAYGFLLSLMPALLVTAYLLYRTVATSTEAATELILQMGFLGNVFDIADTVQRFLSTINPGIPGLITLISMLFAAIVLAFSLQRGLTSIFFSQPETNPVKTYLIPLVLEIAVILFVVITVLGSWIYNSFDYLFVNGPLGAAAHFFPLIGLGALTFGAYRIVPPRSPSSKSALAGTIACIVLYGILSIFFNRFMNPERYHLIYGRLGDLILFLAKVYFFFMFFFIGAQFAFTAEFFDAILFTKLRQVHTDPQKAFFLDKMLFASLDSPLAKHFRSYKAGDTIFLHGEDSHDIYFIVSGEVSIFLDNNNADLKHRLALIKSGNFFGEMGYVLANRRSAMAKAHTDLQALVLPPPLFANVLRIDPKADSKVIETLSERLRHTNEQLSSME
jgi:membrane protein